VLIAKFSRENERPTGLGLYAGEESDTRLENSEYILSSIYPGFRVAESSADLRDIKHEDLIIVNNTSRTASCLGQAFV
jgi:hypothetical protein